jgi:hypothetical protein
MSEARILIKSCARHEPNQRFYLFLVNADAVPDSTIKAWHPNIIIQRVTWPYQAERWRGMMCCARAIPLQKILEEYGEPTVYLDSDTLLRGPLTKLFDALENCDLMVQFRPDRRQIGAAGTPYGSTFNNGVIAVRPSAAGIRFAQKYNSKLREYIASGKPLEVYRPEYNLSFVIDQELLYVTYLELQNELVFKPLPVEFNDTRFKPDRIIWHGKASLGKRPQYVREKLYYTNRLLFYPFSVYYSLHRMVRKAEYGKLRKYRPAL